jgi:hypothetical protein
VLFYKKKKKRPFVLCKLSKFSGSIFNCNFYLLTVKKNPCFLPVVSLFSKILIPSVEIEVHKNLRKFLQQACSFSTKLSSFKVNTTSKYFYIGFVLFYGGKIQNRKENKPSNILLPATF